VLAFVLPAAAQAAGSAYVANDAFPGTVSQYAVGAGGLLSPLSPATVATGSNAPTGVAVTPDGKSAYVANLGGTVSQFNIDPVTGALSPKTPASVAGGTLPAAVAVRPDGKSAYVANANLPPQPNGAVSQFSIDPLTGALSPKSPASVPAGFDPVGIAVTPDGKSAYVPNANLPSPNGNVSQYSIDPLTGALSPKTPPTVPAGLEPVQVAVTPDGKSAYVTNDNGGGAGGSISQYNIDPVTGALSPKTPASVPAVGPYGIAVSPDGKNAYAANLGGNTVSQFSIDPVTGALSPKTPATAPAGIEPVGVAVTPDGKSAYVTNFNNFAPTGTVSQYDIDPVTGTLSPKNPATVSSGPSPTGIAVRPLPRAPTSKDQCKNGGWHNFPQFHNQGDCVSFVQTGK
jgi:DNA-binding beta-propeller fold protein YncE